MNSEAVLGWLGIVAVLAVVGTLTAGAGYLIGVASRRRQARRWVSYLCGAAAALVAPAVLVGWAAFGAMTYQPSGPNDPGDLPGLALAGMVMLSPLFACLGLPFALLGVYWSRRRGGGAAPRRSTAPLN